MMKVLEIKNNLVKIAYDTEDNLAISEFVVIEDTNNPYVAQVMNIKADTSSNFAIVKLLFTFNEEGILKNYNGTIPSQKATVSKLPSNELLDIIPLETPLVLGTLAQQDIKLQVDKTILENNLLICSNNLANTTTLLNNIIPQITEKSIILDTEGQFEWERTITVGKDFKLPLNQDTINYIYENDLEDIDATSKAIIQDIFIEVQEYIQTLPERFLPFDTFLSVIDGQYRETQLPQLILLKNKLLKYKEHDIFAQTLKDILDLSITIEGAKNLSIDISGIDENLQKEVIRYLYTVFTSFNEQIYVYVKANNSNISKRLLKRYITRDNVFTIVICPHEFKYIEEIKEAAQNIIFFAPLTLQHDFASYNTFLSKLNSDEFIVYGAHTQNIPLIAELSIIEDAPTTNVIPMPESSGTEENIEITEPDNIVEDNLNENIFDEDTLIQEEVIQEGEVEEDNENYDFPEISYPDVELDQVIEEEPIIEDTYSDAVEETVFEDDTEDEVNDTIQEDEYYPVETSEEEIVVEPLEDNFVEDSEVYSVETENKDELVEQVAKDIDRVFYEKLPTEDYDNYAQEELTEDDLNLIDDLSVDEDITLAGDETADELNFDEEQPPVVPIYPADDIEDNGIPTFNPGDRVSSPKFGEGVVERMVPYGNKTLCSINFVNVGRRLLDPAVTEITKEI